KGCGLPIYEGIHQWVEHRELTNNYESAGLRFRFKYHRTCTSGGYEPGELDRPQPPRRTPTVWEQLKWRFEECWFFVIIFGFFFFVGVIMSVVSYFYPAR